jgi:acyl-CoA thioesterase-2
MTFSLDALLSLLALEELEVNIFRGQSHDVVGAGRVFGGQVLAQALVAAGRTVEGDRVAHSLHSYFILPGDVTAPIVYFVERLRDGRSFTTRRVTAIQHGHAIFEMQASFQTPERGAEHQAEMPDVPPPEEVESDLARARAQAEGMPPALRAFYSRDWPLEFRTVDAPSDPSRPGPRPPSRCMWLRTVGAIPAGDGMTHQSVLAYASDYSLLGTALLPHGFTFAMPGLQAATLDHAIWFHRPFRADEWLLYVTDSPNYGGSRGFARGSVFTRDGTLVASVAQEGLLRVRAGE